MQLNRGQIPQRGSGGHPPRAEPRATWRSGPWPRILEGMPGVPRTARSTEPAELELLRRPAAPRPARARLCRESARSRRRPRFLLLLWLALSGACHRDAHVNLDRADRLLSLGENKQAVVEYQNALNIEPSAHAQRGLGLA